MRDMVTFASVPSCPFCHVEADKEFHHVDGLRDEDELETCGRIGRRV